MSLPAHRRPQLSRLLSSVVACSISVACATSAAFAYTPLAYVEDKFVDERVGFLYWQQVLDGVPIPFAIGDAGTPDIDIPPTHPDIDEFEAMELAVRAWENVPGVNAQFDITRTTTNALAWDGENVIFMGDIGPKGYGGITLLTYDTATGQILETDIHINDRGISWFTSLNDVDGEPTECPCQGTWLPGESQNDIQGLSAHEVGHALGLDHSAVGIRQSAVTPTMYPRGIWNVPGDGARPANSRYRTIEPDDMAGIQALYQPDCGAADHGQLSGVVHDRYDEPTFGAHVVARSVTTNEEIGAMSGVVRGPYDAGAYQLLLPPDTHEVRVERIDNSPPGWVNLQQFGGIIDALVPFKRPEEQDLATSYYKFVYDAVDATPVDVSACTDLPIPFRPIAQMQRIPRLIRIAKPFPIEGTLNAGLTGPLTEATLRYTTTVEGTVPLEFDLPLSGAFSVDVPKQPWGTIVDYTVQVTNQVGETFESQPFRTQVTLSGYPLLMTSKTFHWTISAVDSRHLYEVDDTLDSGRMSYPIGQAFAPTKYGVYVTNHGYDWVNFVPFWDPHKPPPLRPDSFDTDGDGLHDQLEVLFGTDPGNPDTDGDTDIDGNEISEFQFRPGETGPDYFDVIGGVVANDGVTPFGTLIGVRVENTTEGRWIATWKVKPSGRFRWRLPVASGDEYTFGFGWPLSWLGTLPPISGTPGAVVNVGIKQVDIPPPVDPVRESGSDPLNPVSATGLFLPHELESIHLVPDRTPALEDPNFVVLSPDERYAYVMAVRSDTVYKIDTATHERVAAVVVGGYPIGAAITPDGGKLYVALKNDRAIAVLDPVTLSPLVSPISVPGKPWYLSITQDGAAVVATMTGATPDVAFVDVATDTVTDLVSSGLGGLIYLGAQPPDHQRLVAGRFHTW